MCDYSLHNVKTRPARVGEKLITRDFGTGSRGFAASEDENVAVCLLPSTELAFAEDVRRLKLWPWSKRVIRHKTAIFRQINKHERVNQHDALEFPDGEIVLLTCLETGQEATVPSAIFLSFSSRLHRSSRLHARFVPGSTRAI